MKTRRCLVLGFALLAGCASQTATKLSSGKPSSSSAHLNKLAAQPVPPPVEEPKWEAAAGPSASDLLAQKAAEYAKTMQTPDGVPAPTDTNDAALALLGGPSKRGKKKPPEPIADAPPAVDRSPKPADPTATAQLASLRTPPHASPMGDDPQTVPESADFQSPGARASTGDPLGDRLQKRVAQNPRDIASQLDLQLYAMLNDDPVSELATVSALPSDDRELVSALLDGLSNFRSTVRSDGNMLAAQKIKPLLEMADRLRSQADLTVATVELCSRVEAYGKYTPISPARFPAGQSNAAIVYCEVENFLARQNPEQMWQTRLTEEVTLFTDQGMMVWSDTKREVTDECRNRRHDFFAYNVIHLPANLTIGRYMLKVSIEDKNAGRVAEATVPLSIVGQ